MLIGNEAYPGNSGARRNSDRTQFYTGGLPDRLRGWLIGSNGLAIGRLLKGASDLTPAAIYIVSARGFPFTAIRISTLTLARFFLVSPFSILRVHRSAS